MAKLEIKSDLPLDRFPDSHPVVALSPCFKGLDDTHRHASIAANQATTALSALWASNAVLDENVKHLSTYVPTKDSDRTAFERYEGAKDKFREKSAANYDKTRVQVETAETKLEQLEVELRKLVANAVTPPITNHVLAAEIRQHVKTLGTNKFSFINSAITAGDVTTLSAVLHSSAPLFLTGIDPEQRAQFIEHAATKLAPSEHTQANAIAKARERLSAQWSQFHNRFAEAASKSKPDPRRASAEGRWAS